MEAGGLPSYLLFFESLKHVCLSVLLLKIKSGNCQGAMHPVDYNVIPVSHDDAVSVNLLSGRICNSNFMYQTSCEHGLLPKSNKIFPGSDGQGSSVLHCNADGKIAQLGQGFQVTS